MLTRFVSPALGEDFRRAWSLVMPLNNSCSTPLIETRKGGPAGGSAAPTATGLEVLTPYRAMERKAAEAVSSDIAAFNRLLARHPEEVAARGIKMRVLDGPAEVVRLHFLRDASSS